MASKRARAIVPVSQSLAHVNMMVYGDPGVGKTPLAGTSPKCLIMDCDPDGTASAASLGSKADKWVIRDHDDLLECYEYLRHGGADDYEWVWWDSVTLFQERGLDQIMTDLVAAKPHRFIWAPDKGEYGQNMQRIKIMMRNFVDLPINFGVTAHTLRTEDQDGRIIYMPWIQGRNMPDTICGYMGIVAYMYARRKEGGSIERAIRTQKDGKFYARDRFGALPKIMKSPTIPEIQRLVSEKMASGTTKSSRTTTKKATVQKTTKRTTRKAVK